MVAEHTVEIGLVLSFRMIIESLRLASHAVEPSSLLVIFFLIGVGAAILRFSRLALYFQGAALTIIVLVGILPGGTWLALPLEKWFPNNPTLPDHVDGIIALGGAEQVLQSAAWHQPVFSDIAPVLALLVLGRRYPDAKLVFTGGTHPRDAPSPTEADIVRQFIRALNMDDGRIIYESQSQNTLENALFSRELVHPDAGQRWVLITEAISMPRAVAVFHHAGWNVIPFPAGYRSNGDGRLSLSLDLPGQLNLASIAEHEWGGLFAYRLMGYTDELFPD